MQLLLRSFLKLSMDESPNGSKPSFPQASQPERRQALTINMRHHLIYPVQLGETEEETVVLAWSPTLGVTLAAASLLRWLHEQSPSPPVRFGVTLSLDTLPPLLCGVCVETGSSIHQADLDLLELLILFPLPLVR